MVFGGRSGCLLRSLWEVDPGASRRSLWVFLGSLWEVDLGGEPLGGRLGLCEGVHVERMLASLSLWVSLGSLLEVDVGLMKVSMLS